MSKDFIWGAATSSYQIEGAANEDGKGKSIWDIFAHTPGKISDKTTGDVAIDHYHRFKEDIQHMVDLGITAYRFSISWPRLFPKDAYTLNRDGLRFYNELINELLANNIQPFPTLYHWDLPQYLEEEGGWENRNTAIAFGHYAKVCAQEFGDRINQWTTLNEPWCTTYLGYFLGNHAPGKKSAKAAIAAAHHTALAHGIGVRAIKGVLADASVGLTVNMNNMHTDSDESEVKKNFDLVDSAQNRWWIDAFTTGKYPANLVQEYGVHFTQVFMPGDEALLKVDTDFLGVNYYTDGFVGKATSESKSIDTNSPYPIKCVANLELPEKYFTQRTDFQWPVTPDGLRKLLIRIKNDWPTINSIYITENGAAYNNEPDANGEINDVKRVQYIESHIESVFKAIEAGVNVEGYFAWSLFDNFEWAEGYIQRFGLIFVDFKTQKRIPKASFKTYQDIICKNRALTLSK